MEVDTSANSSDRDNDFYSTSHEEIHYIRYIAYAALVIGVIFGGKLLLDEAFEGSSIIVGPTVVGTPSFLPTLQPKINIEQLLIPPTLEPSLFPSFVPFNTEESDDEKKKEEEQQDKEEEEKEKEEEKQKEKETKKAEKDAAKKAKAEEKEEEKKQRAAATLQPTSTHLQKSHKPTREPSIATTEQPSTSSPSFFPSMKPVKIHKTKEPTVSPSFAGTAISTASLAIFQSHVMKWDDLCLMNSKAGKSFLLQYDNETGDILADSSYVDHTDHNHDEKSKEIKENKGEKANKESKGSKGKDSEKDEKVSSRSSTSSSSKKGRHLLSREVVDSKNKGVHQEERKEKDALKKVDSFIPECSQLSYHLSHASSYERIRVKVIGTLINGDNDDNGSATSDDRGGRGRAGQKNEPLVSSSKYSFKNGNDFCQCTLDTSLLWEIDCTACQVIEGKGSKSKSKSSSSSSSTSFPILKLTLDIKAFPRAYESSASSLMIAGEDSHSSVSLIALLLLVSTIFGLGYVMIRKKLLSDDDVTSSLSSSSLFSSFSSVLPSRNGYMRINEQESEEDAAILA
jgi:hypothetical protein